MYSATWRISCRPSRCTAGWAASLTGAGCGATGPCSLERCCCSTVASTQHFSQRLTAVKCCSDPPHASLPPSHHHCWGNWWVFPLELLLLKVYILAVFCSNSQRLSRSVGKVTVTLGFSVVSTFTKRDSCENKSHLHLLIFSNIHKD